MKKLQSKKGFTLIELLIVIAIIAIIAAMVYVALDPAKRFKESRVSSRWSAMANTLDAIKLHQTDNAGAYLTSIENMATGTVYMVTDGVVASGCDDISCHTTDVDGDSYCVNLAGLVSGGYLGKVPVSPDGETDWSTSSLTGYTLEKDDTGIVTIRACDGESDDELKLVR